jgi:hypothetical protein
VPIVTITPTLGTVSKGAAELSIGKVFDLDTGKLSTDAGGDMSLQKVEPASMQLVPVNGTKLANMGTLQANDSDCRSAPLQAGAVPLENLKVGGFWCYRTSQGLPGTFQVISVTAKEGKINFDYLTWAIP